MNDFTEAEFSEIVPTESPTIRVASFGNSVVEGLLQACVVLERVATSGAFVAPCNVLVTCADKDQFREACRLLGTFQKTVDDTYFNAKRYFDGGVSIEVYIERAKVCQRRVVGKRLIPEKVIPAREEEIVEWECTPSVLTAMPAAATERLVEALS